MLEFRADAGVGGKGIEGGGDPVLDLFVLGLAAEIDEFLDGVGLEKGRVVGGLHGEIGDGSHSRLEKGRAGRVEEVDDGNKASSLGNDCSGAGVVEDVGETVEGSGDEFVVSRAEEGDDEFETTVVDDGGDVVMVGAQVGKGVASGSLQLDVVLLGMVLEDSEAFFTDDGVLKVTTEGEIGDEGAGHSLDLNELGLCTTHNGAPGDVSDDFVVDLLAVARKDRKGPERTELARHVFVLEHLTKRLEASVDDGHIGVDLVEVGGELLGQGSDFGVFVVEEVEEGFESSFFSPHQVVL